ncbi:MAG: hypothetical protein FJ117_14060 [Deltaproteobacteria bacterium]|nr:hypothetical protein [Deltaproteobacteria bacterium]
MKKIFFIFLTFFSLILFSFSVIYSLDNHRGFIPEISFWGQHAKIVIPEHVMLFFLGVTMIVLAGLVKKKFFKS